MANNFGANRGGGRGQNNQGQRVYFDDPQQYNADQNTGPRYESNDNQRNQRNNSFNRCQNSDGPGRNITNDRSGRGGQRGRSHRNSVGRGRAGAFNEGGTQRGGRGARGSFDPLPARIDWPQQLEYDRQQASLNWAPSFRNASISIPPQFYTHTKDEQLVLGQELMDLAVSTVNTT